MAYRYRPTRRGKQWEVYWNNPYSQKRETLYFDTEEEAKKENALKIYQLKYEKKLFQPSELENSPSGMESDTLESVFWLYLRDKNYNKKALSWQLIGMKDALELYGAKQMGKITKNDLEKVKYRMTIAGIKPITVRKKLNVIFALFRWAYKEDYLDSLPKFPDLPPHRYESFIPPTPAEAEQIMLFAPSHIRRVIILGAKIGMRVGQCELFKLKWEDVDLRRGVVRVQAARKNPHEPWREVPIKESLITLFLKWRTEDEAMDMPWVVHYQGHPVQSIKTAWRATLRRAGISRRIRPYDLRHAFATDAIAAGADPGTVARLMGHTSPLMVLKHYQHVVNKQKIQAVESLPDLDFLKQKCGALNVAQFSERPQ